MASCIYCGAPLESSAIQCPYCGQTILREQRPSAARMLTQQLEQIEACRPIKQSKGLFSQALSGYFPSDIDKREISLIQNCIIPNTKEDILEFATLASSNIRPEVFGIIGGTPVGSPQRMLSDAWTALLEQAYQKATVVLNGLPELYDIEQRYVKKTKAVRKKKRQLPIVFAAYFGFIFLIIILTLLLF